MTTQRFWAEGRCVDALTLPCRASDFGDGVFETLRIVNGQALLLDYHLDRLMRGARCLHLNITRETAAEQLARALSGLGAVNGSLRLNCTRHASARGYRFDPTQPARLWFTYTELNDNWRRMAAPVTVGVSNNMLSYQPQLLGLKHMNRLEQVLASDEARRCGVDELVMRDDTGAPVSLIAGNLFVLRPDDHWCTPKLTRAGLAGTLRRFLLDNHLGDTPVHEGVLTLADLHNAKELFYCNSLIGLRPIAQLGQSRWQQWPNTQRFFNAYVEAVTSC